MPNATRSPRAKSATATLPTDVGDADGKWIDQLDPSAADRVLAIVDDLPKDLAGQILSAAVDARALAWLMFDLVERFEHLRTAVTEYCWRDIERVNSDGNTGGPFILAVQEESGIGVVDDVLSGLEYVLSEALHGHSRSDKSARRHAADHYRETGKPGIVLAVDEDEPEASSVPNGGVEEGDCGCRADLDHLLAGMRIFGGTIERTAAKMLGAQPIEATS